MSFELEWGLALAALVVFVLVLFLLPKKKPSKIAIKNVNPDDPPLRSLLFFCVLRSIVSDESVYGVCKGQSDEFLFLRLSSFHLDMSFGHVQGKSFLTKLLENTRHFVGFLIGAVVIAVLLGVGVALGMQDQFADFVPVVVVVVVGVPLIVGLILLMSPLMWMAAKASERQYAKELAKAERLELDDLRDAANQKPNLRATRADLANSDIDYNYDDSTKKIGTLIIKHPQSGTWKFDLYTDEDLDAVRTMLNLPPRKNRQRRKPQTP